VDQSYTKLARILRISPGDLLKLDKGMSAITGQKDVIASIAKENEMLVAKNLAELGLSEDVTAEEVYTALINKLSYVDKHLYELLGYEEYNKFDQNIFNFKIRTIS